MIWLNWQEAHLQVAGFNIWNYNKNLEDSLALEALKRSDVHPGPRRNDPAVALTMSNAFICEVDLKHYRTVFTLQVKNWLWVRLASESKSLTSSQSS